VLRFTSSVTARRFPASSARSQPCAGFFMVTRTGRSRRSLRRPLRTRRSRNAATSGSAGPARFPGDLGATYLQSNARRRAGGLFALRLTFARLQSQRLQASSAVTPKRQNAVGQWLRSRLPPYRFRLRGPRQALTRPDASGYRSPRRQRVLGDCRTGEWEVRWISSRKASPMPQRTSS
jgi:hypothetical protein